MELSRRQRQLNASLSGRLHSVLNDIRADDLFSKDDVNLFELVVRVIFHADRISARHVADLMNLISLTNKVNNDNQVVTESSAFIDDFLKKDYVLYAIANHLKLPEIENE